MPNNSNNNRLLNSSLASPTARATALPLGRTTSLVNTKSADIRELDELQSVGSTSGFGIRPKLTKTRSRAKSILGPSPSKPASNESTGRASALSPHLRPTAVSLASPTSRQSIPEIRTEFYGSDSRGSADDPAATLSPDMNMDADAASFGMSGIVSCQNARKGFRRSGSKTLLEGEDREGTTTPFRRADSQGRAAERHQSIPSPARPSAYLRSPSSSSFIPLTGTPPSSKREGLTRRTSSPNMRAEALKGTDSPENLAMRSNNGKYGSSTPIKAARDGGLGLMIHEGAETVLPSLPPTPMNNTGNAVASAVSNTMSKTRFRSGSVGSQATEERSSSNSAGTIHQNGQTSRTRYNRAFTTSRIDLPSEITSRVEPAGLPAWTEANETPSNPPSPKILKGKGRAYDPDLGMDIYPEDADNLGLNDQYASRRTSQSFGSSRDSMPLTRSSTMPTSLDSSTHLAELAPPAVTTAAGGILTGLWLAGTQVGKAIGLIPQDPPPGDYQNDTAYSQGKRRSSAWMPYPSVRRTSASDGEDSEKGLLSHENSDEDEHGPARDTQSYFDLPKSDYARTSQTLPTPALSAKSLSNPEKDQMRLVDSGNANFNDSRFGVTSFRRMKNMVMRGNLARSMRDGMASPEAKAFRQGRTRSGTLTRRSGAADTQQDTVKMDVALKQVVGELSWTLGTLGLVFVVSLGVVAASLVSLPISSLKSLPKKVSDLQVLSAEIRTYMDSSSTGWWHTVFVLLVTGMWKHSWSVPGAVVLNILVGSILSPFPALLLLTIITSFGSLGAYLLSRPLAPLIALIFPKPLALVRSTINGAEDATDKIPMNDLSTRRYPSKSPAEPTVWRRLLIMRAMGLVPWSGMNVACGVVRVNPITFLLTTAAGTASWSYVTASIGDILHQMALPGQVGAGLPGGAADGGQSLASLVRDPALIFKMVVLSLISLIPVLFKSRSSPVEQAPPPLEAEDLDFSAPPLLSPTTQAMTPLGPSPSFYALISLGNNIYRRTTRALATGWKNTIASALGHTTSQYQTANGGETGAGFPS
ncbi:hypothetical protein NliqN6_0863 [Naganishia liquefaciens]|uniref:VTT domain-containing protein n=1 Tax=Naganishia liquefaciens TaxID=104408 RepID=A0A8H3YE67_9TREE|nr:hypothetical protein NliqN6_0863 [Naganishia liquefaciens]